MQRTLQDLIEETNDPNYWRAMGVEVEEDTTADDNFSNDCYDILSENDDYEDRDETAISAYYSGIGYPNPYK